MGAAISISVFQLSKRDVGRLARGGTAVPHRGVASGQSGPGGHSVFTVRREPGAEDVSALFVSATLPISTKDAPQASSHGPGHTDPGTEAVLCAHPTHVLLPQDTEMWDSYGWFAPMEHGVSEEGGFQAWPREKPYLLARCRGPHGRLRP